MKKDWVKEYNNIRDQIEARTKELKDIVTKFADDLNIQFMKMSGEKLDEIKKELSQVQNNRSIIKKKKKN